MAEAYNMANTRERGKGEMKVWMRAAEKWGEHWKRLERLNNCVNNFKQDGLVGLTNMRAGPPNHLASDIKSMWKARVVGVIRECATDYWVPCMEEGLKRDWKKLREFLVCNIKQCREDKVKSRGWEGSKAIGKGIERVFRDRGCTEERKRRQEIPLPPAEVPSIKQSGRIEKRDIEGGGVLKRGEKRGPVNSRYEIDVTIGWKEDKIEIIGRAIYGCRGRSSFIYRSIAKYLDTYEKDNEFISRHIRMRQGRFRKINSLKQYREALLRRNFLLGRNELEIITRLYQVQIRIFKEAVNNDSNMACIEQIGQAYERVVNILSKQGRWASIYIRGQEVTRGVGRGRDLEKEEEKRRVERNVRIVEGKEERKLVDREIEMGEKEREYENRRYSRQEEGDRVKNADRLQKERKEKIRREVDKQVDKKVAREKEQEEISQVDKRGREEEITVRKDRESIDYEEVERVSVEERSSIAVDSEESPLVLLDIGKLEGRIAECVEDTRRKEREEEEEIGINRDIEREKEGEKQGIIRSNRQEGRERITNIDSHLEKKKRRKGRQQGEDSRVGKANPGEGMEKEKRKKTEGGRKERQDTIDKRVDKVEPKEQEKAVKVDRIRISRRREGEITVRKDTESREYNKVGNRVEEEKRDTVEDSEDSPIELVDRRKLDRCLVEYVEEIRRQNKEGEGDKGRDRDIEREREGEKYVIRGNKGREEGDRVKIIEEKGKIEKGGGTQQGKTEKSRVRQDILGIGLGDRQEEKRKKTEEIRIERQDSIDTQRDDEEGREKEQKEVAQVDRIDRGKEEEIIGRKDIESVGYDRVERKGGGEKNDVVVDQEDSPIELVDRGKLDRCLAEYVEKIRRKDREEVEERADGDIEREKEREDSRNIDGRRGEASEHKRWREGEEDIINRQEENGSKSNIDRHQEEREIELEEISRIQQRYEENREGGDREVEYDMLVTEIEKKQVGKEKGPGSGEQTRQGSKSRQEVSVEDRVEKTGVEREKKNKEKVRQGERTTIDKGREEKLEDSRDRESREHDKVEGWGVRTRENLDDSPVELLDREKLDRYLAEYAERMNVIDIEQESIEGKISGEIIEGIRKGEVSNNIRGEREVERQKERWRDRVSDVSSNGSSIELLDTRELDRWLANNMKRLRIERGEVKETLGENRESEVEEEEERGELRKKQVGEKSKARPKRREMIIDMQVDRSRDNMGDSTQQRGRGEEKEKKGTQQYKEKKVDKVYSGGVEETERDKTESKGEGNSRRKNKGKIEKENRKKRKQYSQGRKEGAEGERERERSSSEITTSSIAALFRDKQLEREGKKVGNKQMTRRKVWERWKGIVRGVIRRGIKKKVKIQRKIEKEEQDRQLVFDYTTQGLTVEEIKLLGRGEGFCVIDHKIDEDKTKVDIYHFQRRIRLHEMFREGLREEEQELEIGTAGTAALRRERRSRQSRVSIRGGVQTQDGTIERRENVESTSVGSNRRQINEGRVSSTPIRREISQRNGGRGSRGRPSGREERLEVDINTPRTTRRGRYSRLSTVGRGIGERRLTGEARENRGDVTEMSREDRQEVDERHRTQRGGNRENKTDIEREGRRVSIVENRRSAIVERERDRRGSTVRGNERERDGETEQKEKGRRLPSMYDPESKNRSLNRYNTCIQEEILLGIEDKKTKFKDNISKEERIALRALKKRIEDKEIIITRADKGSGLVAIDYEMYIKKGTKYIEEEVGAYNKVQESQQCIINRIIKERNKIAEQLREKGIIMVQTATYIKKQLEEKITGIKFYYKIHKDKNIDTMPLKPLQSCIKAPIQHLSIVLTDILQPLLTDKNISTFIFDSNKLLYRLQKLGNIPDNCTLVSSDVSALYPSIPHREGFRAMKLFLEEKTEYNEEQIREIIAALQLVITENYMTWNNQIYKQISGVAMGTPVAVAYANIFMSWVDGEVKKGAPYIHEHIRFIDDNLFIVPKDRVIDMIEVANNVLVPHIKFTYEKLEDQVGKGLPFLDTQFFITEEKKIESRLYTKSTDRHAYLLPSSFHPAHITQNIPMAVFGRIRKLCSREEWFREDAEKAEGWLLNRGYKQTEIQTAIEKTSKRDRWSMIEQIEKNRGSKGQKKEES